jgi:hypothetical protein
VLHRLQRETPKGAHGARLRVRTHGAAQHGRVSMDDRSCWLITADGLQYCATWLGARPRHTTPAALSGGVPFNLAQQISVGTNSPGDLIVDAKITEQLPVGYKALHE